MSESSFYISKALMVLHPKWATGNGKPVKSVKYTSQTSLANVVVGFVESKEGKEFPSCQ